ncbi:peptidyl-tRNA hydrolase PTH2-domain-containing protein [Amylocystis lapponica]|nr:peptidyl-tRNA hydrolase PTH2-domain-containing protein [Amylocystis lapponica]
MSSPTSQIFTALALVATSLSVGYALGARSAVAVSPDKSTSPPVAGSQEPTESDADSDGEEEVADGDLSAVKPGFMEPCKLVCFIVCASIAKAHGLAGPCACYKALTKMNPKLLQHWERTGQAKIALKANSEDQLMELEAVAKNILCASGRTQIAAGSRTVLGIGPGPVELVNRVTGMLRLL